VSGGQKDPPFCPIRIEVIPPQHLIKTLKPPGIRVGRGWVVRAG
jgi:hypothetical protein